MISTINSSLGISDEGIDLVFAVLKDSLHIGHIHLNLLTEANILHTEQLSM